MLKTGNDAVNKVNRAGQDTIKKIDRHGVEVGQVDQQASPQVRPGGLDEIEKDLKLLAQSGLPAKLGKLLVNAVPEARTQKIGFIDLEVHLRNKIGPVLHWAQHPPKDKDSIIKMVKELTNEDIVEIHPCRIPFVPYIGIDIAIPIHVDNLVDVVDELLDNLI